jgi:hypothetical protein
MRVMLLVSFVVSLSAAGPAFAEAPLDLIEEARELAIVGACADGTPARVSAQLVTAHCKDVRKVQDDYKKSWIAKAVPFFAEKVPATAPKKVVYPFAGGDLASALAVFPDADEITTIALEPAGDPRALGKLSDKQVKSALAVVAKELRALYRLNYSHTMNMIGAMRGGQLPTQLIFTLSALHLHGYEPVAMRYFTLTDDGGLRYLARADLDAADAIKDVTKRNKLLANVEIKFRKLGSKREQTYRHIVANLDDSHLKKEPAALAHIKAKGKVAAMTKAASFLLSFDGFKTMRQYLIDHAAWMVSDATGLPPKYGKPAGFEYETYGTFERSEMDAGAPFSPVWAAEFKAQPKRPLEFRFGYPDHKFRNHLIIMRPAAK